MVFQIDPDMSPELAPLAWMIGRWEGAGIAGYPTMESVRFGQEIEVLHDGRPFLEWRSHSWLLDEQGNMKEPLASELGYWRPEGELEFSLLLAHPMGYTEQYFGSRHAQRPSIELATDGVMRSPSAKEYSSAQRMYGLVDGDLMWVMDMAAMGHPMTSHLSAQLKRVE